MSNEQDRENLNLAMGKLIDQWREFDPEFVAYVERYGGYTDGSAKDKPLRELATHDYKQEIEAILTKLLKKQYEEGSEATQALTHLIETEKKKAYSKGYRNGFAQGQFDKEMNDKYPPEELQGEVE